jgi:transposase
MSLQTDCWREEIPVDTAEVGQAILAADDPYRRVGEEVGDFLHLSDFAALYSALGRRAIAPIILSLVTIFQYLENLPDREAARWAVMRLDWKYALHVPLTWLGFHFTTLHYFRARLLEQGQERLIFDKVLNWIRRHGFLKKYGKQRTDSTHVVGHVARLSRLELVWESLRVVLRAIEQAAPLWYEQYLPAAFHQAYGRRQHDWQLSQDEVAEQTVASGRDGFWLLDLLDSKADESLLALAEVGTLRTVWAQQFERQEQQVAVRQKVTGKDIMVSPHETEARWAEKRGREWQGYKLHVTETVAEPGNPSFLTDVDVSAAVDGDSEQIEPIQGRLSQRALQPEEQYTDEGYVSGSNLAHSQERGIDLVGPAPGDHSRKPLGYRQSDFTLDFERRVAICPQGRESVAWFDFRQADDGYVGAKIEFGRQCLTCPAYQLCTSGRNGRTLEVSPYYQLLTERRAEQTTAAFRHKMKQRAAIEGTLSAAVRKHGARRARYRGQLKVRLQYLFTGAAINLKRLSQALSAPPRVEQKFAVGC